MRFSMRPVSDCLSGYSVVDFWCVTVDSELCRISWYEFIRKYEMKMFVSKKCYVIFMLLSAGFFAGCSTPDKGVSPAEEYTQRMGDADALALSGKQDAAVMAYEKIAESNPAQGAPWSKIAQIKFVQGHYSQAIVAAEETLRRDPSSREAKSVTAVGGLRLAVRSLEDLRNDAALAGDAKVDAVKLALMLRETLGEPVLESKNKPPIRKPIPSRPSTSKSAVEIQAPQVAPAAPAAPSANRGSNPFGSLQ
ncbi:MAG: hypothetical protein LBE51_02020 [Acidovorax sp.]|jgi:hypothetical protein|nr:hypothetical protein [Acidovorax sp.]